MHCQILRFNPCVFMEMLTFTVAQKRNTSLSNRRVISQFVTEQLQKRNYYHCIDVCQSIGEKNEQVRSYCQYQIGMVHFFLGNYQQAIDCYLLACRQGEAIKVIEEDIWEAYQMLYKETNDKRHLVNYIESCPNGQYTKEAKKILSIHYYE